MNVHQVRVIATVIDIRIHPSRGFRPGDGSMGVEYRRRTVGEPYREAFNLRVMGVPVIRVKGFLGSPDEVLGMHGSPVVHTTIGTVCPEGQDDGAGAGIHLTDEVEHCCFLQLRTYYNIIDSIVNGYYRCTMFNMFRIWPSVISMSGSMVRVMAPF